MTRFLLAAMAVVMSAPALAQSPDVSFRPPAQSGGVTTAAPGVSTPTGHELNVGLGGYTYVEPDPLRISIHGAKFSAEYTGTFALNRNRHWFVQADVRGVTGSTTYDGWCRPWMIVPSALSPNGYDLGLGDASPCSETGDSDWYVESRALVGKDFVARTWGLSPHTGVGFRHLSNALSGISGFRTDDYLYLPFGLTARTTVASNHALSFTAEYDLLLRGWQNTHQSALGSGTAPATPDAPAFTIEGFTDLAFEQHSGWAMRASATYRLSRSWSVTPSYVYWRVASSPTSTGTVAFTVNGLTAVKQFGAYEPLNMTHEFAVKLGFHF